jgi:kanamycin kinase
MTNRPSVEPRPIPTPALLGMENWYCTVAWAYVPDSTTWRLTSPAGEVRYLKVARLGWQGGLGRERERLTWAAGWIPVPAVLGYGSDTRDEWLLTAALPGENAASETHRADPTRLVPLLGATLRRFHDALPVNACPFDGPARAAGVALPRPEDPVVAHGDACLPNFLFADWSLAGYLDLGDLGVADRWWDLATTTWSVTRNLGPGWEDAFLAAYGLSRDAEKHDFYRRLYHAD